MGRPLCVQLWEAKCLINITGDGLPGFNEPHCQPELYRLVQGGSQETSRTYSQYCLLLLRVLRAPVQIKTHMAKCTIKALP